MVKRSPAPCPRGGGEALDRSSGPSGAGASRAATTTHDLHDASMPAREEEGEKEEQSMNRGSLGVGGEGGRRPLEATRGGAQWRGAPKKGTSIFLLDSVTNCPGWDTASAGENWLSPTQDNTQLLPRCQ